MNGKITEKELAAYIRHLTKNGRWQTQEIPLPPVAGWQGVSPIAGQEPKYRIRISDDRMEASITVIAASIRAGELDPREILQQMLSLGIQANLDGAALLREIRSPSGEPIVLARGRLPVPGQEARWVWDGGMAGHSWPHPDADLSDVCGDLRPPYVKKGDPIGEIQPKREGRPGLDLFGREVPPSEVRDIKWKEGDGVRILEDGRVVAVRDGRPRIRGDHLKIVDVCPSRIVAGDVNRETGSVIFAGDVVVMGSVNESTAIEALGNVYVNGDVCGAKIAANGSIYVRGSLFRSELTSGWGGFAFSPFSELSSRLWRRLDELMPIWHRLCAASGPAGNTVCGRILARLLEHEFKDIPALAKQLSAVLAQGTFRLYPCAGGLAELLSRLQPSMYLRQCDVPAFLQAVRSRIEAVWREFVPERPEEVRISLGQCRRSNVESAGDIRIRGEGVFQSGLFAGGSIRFLRPDSVCQASRLAAVRRIEAGIVGGESSPAVSLTAGQRVSAVKMYGGTVRVGKRFTNVAEPESLFHMEDGQA